MVPKADTIYEGHLNALEKEKRKVHNKKRPR
jgi:hypothetical protein